MPCTSLDGSADTCVDDKIDTCDTLVLSADKLDCVESPTGCVDSLYGRCIECGSTEFLSEFTGTCVSCSTYWDSNCLSCNSTLCLDCDGLTWDDVNHVCYDEIDDCETLYAFDKTVCEKCIDGYFFNTTSKTCI